MIDRELNEREHQRRQWLTLLSTSSMLESADEIMRTVDAAKARVNVEYELTIASLSESNSKRKFLIENLTRTLRSAWAIICAETCNPGDMRKHTRECDEIAKILGDWPQLCVGGDLIDGGMDEHGPIDLCSECHRTLEAHEKPATELESP